MRISLLLVAALGTATTDVALARSSSSGRPSSSAPRRTSGGSGSRGGGSSSSGRGGGKGSRRRPDPVDDYDDEDPLGIDAEDEADGGGDEYDDYDEEEYAPRRGAGGGGSRRGGPGPARGGPPPPRQAGGRRPPPSGFDDYDEEDYDNEYPPPSRRAAGGGSRGERGGPPPRGSSRGRGPPPRGGPEGRVVSYDRSRRRGAPPPPPSTFTRGLSAIRDRIPDPTVVKETMLSATKAAQEKTSQLSSNIYREVKGLTSSELEQVMLKATRPDETPVKTKHVERLVGVTYQISGKYDIYDAVLRKLWNKMAEKDIRTKLKSVYVLHRFSVDGGPEHQEALKQRLRALRKTKDPKRSSGGRGGTRYFDSKVLIGQDNDPETQGYRAFLSRYAHYVLTRAQTFGGIFNEISLAQAPAPSPTTSSKKGSRSKSKAPSSPAKPKNPPLCEEHLKFAQMVLKAGLACALHDGEESESTAMCVERVAADLMGLAAATAVALKRELKRSKIEDESTVRRWCEFYSDDLLPETKKFCKRVTPKLDAYGLYLPSRIGSTLSQELLEKGLKLGSGSGDEKESPGEEEQDEGEEEATGEEKSEERVEDKADGAEKKEDADASIALSAGAAAASSSSAQDDENEYDEYEYDEYDDEYE